MVQHLDENNLLCDEQNGFCKNRLRAHHIFSLTSIICNRMQQGQHTYCTFVNFSKAFDVVDRELMFLTMVKNGICGQILTIARQLYTNTMNTVCINNMFSEEFCSKNGMRQGDNYSPTAFGNFINGLIEELKNTNVGVNLGSGDVICNLAYADDIVLLAESSENLQKLLTVLESWCKKWRVLVNTSKTKAMLFRKRRSRPNDPVLSLYGQKLEDVYDYKYLGITLNCHLDQTHTLEILARAASRALGAMLSMTRTNYDLGYRTYTRLFNATVVPILDYAFGAWSTGGWGAHQKMDIIQNRAMRFFCGLPRASLVASLIGDMGWLPGVIRRDLDCLRFYNQLISMKNDRFTKRVFDYDQKLMLPGGWSQNVRTICASVGREEAWKDSKCINLVYAWEKLLEWYVQVWKQEINCKTKLEVYRELKKEWGVADVLKVNMDKYERSLICRTRHGVLPLEVEKAHFSRVVRHQRICKLCNSAVETEYHFLFDCVKLNKTCIEHVYECPELLNFVDNAHKLTYLHTKPYLLGRYIVKLWHTHELLTSS